MKQNKNKFAEKRKSLGLTQEQAAKLMKRSVSTITKWEVGKHACHDRNIEELELRFLAQKQ